jgi:hypothetical protein
VSGGFVRRRASTALDLGVAYFEATMKLSVAV